MKRANTALLAALVLLSGCPEPKSERVLLIEAATLSQDGHTEQARAIYLRLLEERDPPSHDVAIRYAGFLIDNGELEAASAVLAQLEHLGLRGTDRARLDAERRRYFERIYEDARGDGPGAPADPAAYERGIIGLINLERTGPMLDEYNEYLVMQARAALGRSPTQPVPMPPDPVAQAASPEQIENALRYLGRLLDGDPRAEVRRPPEGPIASEAEALRAALLVERFQDAFEYRWTNRHRDAFARDGRLDPDARNFLHHYVGPYREGHTAELGEVRLTHHARTWYAREIATDLAYELAGIPRDGAPPLPFAVEDFVTTVASGVAEDEAGNFVFDLVIPYRTVMLGGWLLQQRLDAEGSGDTPPDGSDAPGHPTPSNCLHARANDCTGGIPYPLHE